MPQGNLDGIEPYADLASLMKAVHADLVFIGFEPDRRTWYPPDPGKG